MKIELEDIRDKLENGYYENEEHVRLSLVSRILFELEWDIWNPREVNTEYIVVPNEDSTRVDIALFLNRYAGPSVYIEIKSVGKLQQQLSKIETQLRDYNRNNTAIFTVLTDGVEWRFYYSQTGGEFSNKCFKVVSFLEDEIEDIETSFYQFLSRSEIESDNAKAEAESYLKLNQKQRALEDALPKAKRLTLELPYPSLPDAIINIVTATGFEIDREEVIKFIQQENTDQIKKEKRVHTSRNTKSDLIKKSIAKEGQKSFPPPENTKCKFVYKGETYYGIIEKGSLNVEGFSSYSSFSTASGDITQTSRNGWLDWELSPPGVNGWILADHWRKK
jgi:hypothetical protein